MAKQSENISKIKTSIEGNLSLQEFLNASPDPVLIATEKAKISYVNSAWEKFTGYSFFEVKDKNPRLLQSGKTPRDVYKKMWEVLSSGGIFRSDDIIDRKKDGSLYQAHSVIFPIKNKDKILFYVQIQHDVTRQKEIERQKDAFIGIASHELKTPITALYAYAQILSKNLIEGNKDERKLYFINNLKTQVEKLTNLVDDLLNVSRIQAGGLTIRFKTFDFHSIVEKVVSDFQHTTEMHEVKFEATGRPMVEGDENRIEQVVLNLLSNAVKYSSESKKINVKLFVDDVNAVVSVQDFGVGIEKEDLPNIFQRFYRAKSMDTGKVLGFGLGLYIASEIIRKHNGRIWVKSKLGKGSTFYFSIPLKRK